MVDANATAPDIRRERIEDHPLRYDVAILSNVYEHLPDPVHTLRHIRSIAGGLWLSFTPWRSPFGGHEFSPRHLLGATHGCTHRLGVNLFKTSRASVLSHLCLADWTVIGWRSRYFMHKIRNDTLLWNIEVWAK